jgi:hypothetical protein
MFLCKGDDMSIRNVITGLRIISVLMIAGFLFIPETSAVYISDPCALFPAMTIGFGGGFELGEVELDDGRVVDNSRILAEAKYSVIDQMGIFLKAGLFRTESFLGDNTDWGLGVSLGLRSYLFQFQGGRIRIGLDGQIFRAQTNFSEQLFSSSLSRDEDVTWTEYQISALVSWRAYDPISLYTGVQLYIIDAEYDVSIYHWLDGTREKSTLNTSQDQPVSLILGFNYTMLEKVELYAELKTHKELSLAAGLKIAI